MTIEERFAKLDNGKLAYYHISEPDNEIYILFLHGSAGEKEWVKEPYTNPTFQLNKYNWIVPDLMGYGNSDRKQKLSQLSMKQFAQDMYDLLIREKVKNLVILGHSMGGTISPFLNQLLKNEKSIHLIACFNMEGPICIEDINDIYGKVPYEEFIEIFNKEQSELPVETNPKAKWVHDHLAGIGPFTIWAVFTNFTNLLKESDLSMLYSDISLRNQYYIAGDKEDRPINSENLAKEIGLKVITIPNAGHNMFLDNPDDFWKFLHEFIN